MKVFISIYTVGLLLISNQLYAQKQIKRDTLYYWVDTAKIPAADRMFVMGQEGDLYGYRLTCQCNRFQSDFYFVRKVNQKALILNRQDLKKYKFITLRTLFEKVIKFGLDEKRENEFCFVVPQYDKEDQFLLYDVFLTVPHNDGIRYDTHK